MGSSIHTASQEILQQGIELLETITQADYTRQHAFAQNASIGAHYRHCLEHFEPLLELDSDVINYDARKRDLDLETDLSTAFERTWEYAETCDYFTLFPLNKPVKVITKVSYAGQEETEVMSTLEREWMYCISHTIHHYAIISLICRQQNISVPPDFGVAPSTQKHLQKLELDKAASL